MWQAGRVGTEQAELCLPGCEKENPWAECLSPFLPYIPPCVIAPPTFRWISPLSAWPSLESMKGKSLGTPLRGFLDQVLWSRNTHPKCGQHLLIATQIKRGPRTGASLSTFLLAHWRASLRPVAIASAAAFLSWYQSQVSSNFHCGLKISDLGIPSI